MVSILIPVYNEENILKENVEKLISYLDEDCPEYEILICDNGSTDNTKDIGKSLETFHPKKVRFLSTKSRGVGSAFKEMVSKASHEKLISIDIDLSTNIDFIPKCIDRLNEYDIVIGSKMMGEQYRPLHRIIISKTYIHLMSFLLGIKYGDSSIGCKGFRKSKIIEYMDDINDGSSYTIELYYKLKKTGKIHEIPIICHDTRPSRFNLVSEIIYRFRSLISFWLKNR